MKQQKRKGFTLVELLVVIAILAILATVSIVGYTAFIERAHKSNALTEANQIKEAIRAELIAGNEIVINKVEPAADATDKTTTTYAIAHNGENAQLVVTTATEKTVDGKTVTETDKKTYSIKLVGRDYNFYQGNETTPATGVTFPAKPDCAEIKALVDGLDGELVLKFDAKLGLTLLYTYEVDTEKDYQVRINLNNLETAEIVEKAETPAA